MSQGIIGVSQIGDLHQPSPSVWGDCPNTLLPDKGLGYFVNQDFNGDYTTGASAVAAGITSDADASSTFAQAASATYGPNVISPAVSNTDNNALALFTAELGKIVRNSGNKMWAETCIAVGALGDSAFAFGFTTLANATRDLIADNPSNAARAAIASATFVGFVSAQTASALKTVDAIYEKTTGTPVVVLADVTNATAIPSASRANLVANTFVKLGLRFDGGKFIRFYVNGYLVASQEVDSTVDQSSYLVAAFCMKTGAATAVTNYNDFIRAAAQLRS